MDEDRVRGRIALLREVASRSGEDRESLLDAHPELYADQYFPSLAAAVRESPDVGALRAVLDELRGRVTSWDNREADFVIGSAPYEILWLRVRDGRLDQKAAERAAAAIPAPAEAEAYVRALTTLSRRMVPAAAVSLLGILRAAIAARPGGAFADDAGPDAELQFVRSVSQLLVTEADGRLAATALEAGEAVLDGARKRGLRDLELDALLVLGSLCTNPYSGHRSSRNLEVELWQWQHRFWDSHRDELVDLEPEAWQMPPAAASHIHGAEYFRQAAELCTGHDRGRALKAVFQSLAMAESLGERVDQRELLRMGREAAKLMDPDQSPGELVSLLANLDTMGEEIDPKILDTLLQPSFDRRLRDHGASEALELAINSVPLLRKVAPERAEVVAERARPLVDLLNESWARARQWSNELEAVVDAHAPGGFKGLPHGPALDAWRTVESRAKAEDWDPLGHAAALIGMAGRSPHTNDEALGLKLLDAVEELAPVWCLQHRRALLFQRAYLHLGLGVNAVNIEDWATAIASYSTALAGMCDLDLVDAALDVLGRIDDVVAKSGHEGAVNAVVGITPFAVTMENLAGDVASRYVQQICQKALAALLSGGGPDKGVNPEALIIVLQVAKGLRFASLLISRARFRWQEDDEGRELLDRIAEAEAELASRGELGPADLDQPVDEHMLLTAYSTAAAADPEAPEEPVRALRRTYDTHLSSRLLADSRAEDLVFLSVDSLQGALDDRTVLVDVYEGASPRATMAIYAVALTDSTMDGACAISDFPVAEIRLGDDQRVARGSVLSVVAASLRRNLMEPSDPDPLTEESQQDLESLLENYLPGIAGRLDSWRAQGKDHLCIVPHGPMHYVPFHLAQHRGRPLAEDWTVTVLPNHALLLDERGGATTTTRRALPLAAFGLTYPPGNPHGLPPLSHAADEAAAVARVFGREPIVEDDATEERVLEALRSARYLHLAAHGRHDVQAPSFQCVYLAPGAASDGRLRAHELTSLDLRGTDMVTLSACETSLGRVDITDNPRGLPAALFLAGVRTIVGTLWEVRSDTAAFFFTALYQELLASTPRHYAFSAAQRCTREQFPVYRDWGAFCFLGTWT